MDTSTLASNKTVKRAACDRCHVLKSRCSRSAGKNETCDRCRRLGIECVSSAPLRTGRPRGSGMGMSQNIGAARKTSRTPPVASSRTSKTPEPGSTTNLTRHNSPFLQHLPNHPIQSTNFEPVPSSANMNFAPAASDYPNLVEGDLSGSSLDGSMFSEENFFELNAFTPATSNSDDVTIDNPSLGFSTSTWHPLSGTHLNDNSQDQSKTAMMQEFAANHRLFNEPLPYSQPQAPLFDGYVDNTWSTLYPSHVHPQASTSFESDILDIYSQLDATSAEVSHLNAIVMAPNAGDPLYVLDDTLKATKRLIETVALMFNRAIGSDFQISHSESFQEWTGAETSLQRSLATDPGYVQSHRSRFGQPIFMQVASTYMWLIQIYNQIVSFLDHHYQSLSASEFAYTLGQSWAQNMSTHAGSPPFQQSQHTSIQSGSHDAAKSRILFRIIFGMIRRLKTDLRIVLPNFDHESPAQFLLPLQPNIMVSPDQQSTNLTMRDLFTQEQELFAVLQRNLERT